MYLCLQLTQCVILSDGIYILLKGAIASLGASRKKIHQRLMFVVNYICNEGRHLRILMLYFVKQCH